MIGFDVGTYTLVVCERDKDKNFVQRKGINAYIGFPLDTLDNRSIFNIMEKGGAKLIEFDDLACVVGQHAVDLAYTMPGIELKRPMKDGCVNPNEMSSFEILKILVHSLLDNVQKNKQLLYYSVPANAINEETDVDYHRKVLEAIFASFEDDEGRKVDARPINEGLALVYAELGKKAYTGIGISFGAGMVNLCFAVYGFPVFQFSLVNSGDWIDKMAAKALAEDPTFINKEKTKIDLSKPPQNMVDRAIQTQYNLMIEKTVSGIKDGIKKAGKKARMDDPIDIVVAGGSSLPTGFTNLFKKIITQAKLPIDIGKIIRPADPLYSVSRGCLIAAENAGK
jgi:hypothetical protein